jgi:hypothetical protein
MKTEIEIKDRASGQRMWLYLRDGIVVGALGCEPHNWIGLTEAAAHLRSRRRRHRKGF